MSLGRRWYLVAYDTSINAAPAKYEVRAVLHCPMAVACERLGAWADLTALPDDRTRLTMRTESLPWAAVALGLAAVEVSDVEPAELRAALRDWSDRLTRAVE